MIPSRGDQIAIVRTGGFCRGSSEIGGLSTLWSLSASYSRHALLARRSPEKGVPSVITSATLCGWRCASTRA